MVGIGASVPTVLGLFIVVTLVAALVRRTRVPYEVALVLAGLVMAVVPGVPHAQITPTVILTVFLPVLLFHGAYNLSLAELRATARLVAFLALPGVIVTASIVGIALHELAGLPWTAAILFGTIVGATDPVSVLAVFGRVGAPRRLTTAVSGESLFNDGTALVLFSIVLGIAVSGQFSLAGSALQLAVVLAGSSLLGAAVGLVGAQVLSRVDDPLVEISITLIMAYGGYLLAASVGLSGPLATVAAGVLFATRSDQVISPNTRLQATAIWEFLDYLANSLLFLLMGLAVRGAAVAPGGRIGPALVGPLLIALAAVTLSRVAVVLLTRSLMAAVRRPLPRGWSPVLVWAGLRGAVSLAAALSLPLTLADRDLLVVLTFGVVLFTLLAQGLTIAPLLRRVSLAGGSPAGEGQAHGAVMRAEGGEGGLGWGDSPFPAALTDEDLAHRLGIPTATLALLRRVPSPDPADPADGERVTALAELLSADRAVLALLLQVWRTEGLSWALRTYRQRYGLSDASLAAYLRMPEAKLGVLYRSPHPNPAGEDYQVQVSRLAAAAECDAGRLRAVLTAVALQDEQPERLPERLPALPWVSES